MQRGVPLDYERPGTTHKVSDELLGRMCRARIVTLYAGIGIIVGVFVWPPISFIALLITLIGAVLALVAMGDTRLRTSDRGTPSCTCCSPLPSCRFFCLTSS